MSAREKKLALLVGGVVAFFILVFGGRAVFMKPLREADKKTAALRLKMDKVKSERRAFFTAEDSVKRVAQRTFADHVDQASAKSGEMLTKEILLSGLSEGDFSRLPVGPRKLRGASEIGWSIQGQGKLPDVINLVFLLQESPYLHRVENLVLSAGDSPGTVRVGLRYLALVLDPPPVVDAVSLVAKVTLDSPDRRLLDGIVTRDLLRPYVKRTGPAGNAPAGTPEPSGPASLRVVSLSEWMGQPEVHVRDVNNEKTYRYRVGDSLADGTIVMVDYRPLPMPGNDSLKSYSRVIVKVGNEFWAIERGQTLADKRRLAPEQLPEALAKL
jgi:hypothetical protein